MGVTLQSEKEKEWVVRVYRKSVEGWSRMQTKNSNGKLTPVRAVVRKGCILLPRIKVRISLAKQDEERPLSVQRRRDTILVRLRETTRSRPIALRFRSEKDCLEFSDQLVFLNPPVAIKPVGFVTPQTVGNETAEVLSYVARLLTDPTIVELANGLEQRISASFDLKLMLEAFSKSD